MIPFSASPGGIASLLTFTNSLLPILPSGKIAQVFNQATVNGNNDLYTVPAGKRAVLAGSALNQSGGSLNVINQLKINGAYVQVAVTAAVANNASLNLIPFNTLPIAEAGETISLNCNGVLHLFAAIILLDQNDGVRSPKLTTLNAGDNLVYTCPANRIAFITNGSNSGNAPVRSFNQSGGTRTYKLRCVPNGQAPSDTFNLSAAWTTANGVSTNQVIAEPAFMSPGDYLSLNVDAGTATQFFYLLNLVEFPQ